MLEIVLFLSAGAAATIAMVVALRFQPTGRGGAWRANRRVTVTDLATRYEASLLGLTRITIVVPRIEDPAEDPALKQAVKKNLARNVRYIFIVSKDRFQLEQDGYYNVFRMYAREALEAAGGRNPSQVAADVNRLVAIVPLRKNWVGHPYIFYHCAIGLDHYSFAFRGKEANQGIAQTYETVAPEDAAVLYDGVRETVDPEYWDLVSQDLASTKVEEFDAAPARPATVPKQLKVVP